jgi:hypothetical protein
MNEMLVTLHEPDTVRMEYPEGDVDYAGSDKSIGGSNTIENKTI